MENLFYFILVAIIAFAFTAYSIPQIVRVSRAKKLFDEPNSRKLNTTVVPNLGGIAIFIGLTLGVTLGGDGFPFFDLKYIFASLLIIFFTGLKDDLVGISPRSKLTAMAVSIAVIALFSNLKLSHLYGFLGINQLGFIPSLLLTFFVGVVIINSFNLIDGIDGLASSIAIQIATVFGIWFVIIGLPEYALISFSLAGACLAFFIYNVFGHRHKVFMGDTGSLLIGTLIFVLAVKFNEFNAVYTGVHVIKAVPAVLIGFLVYPLFDVLRVFMLRVFVAKKSPFKPDKNHIHHRLLALGMTHLQATIVIFVNNIIFMAGSLFLQKYLNVWQLTAAIFGASLFMATTLELYILFKNKIKPNDEYQQLFLPKLFIRMASSHIA
ncbi:MAG: undecaprenyl/decaprenyl-phosphate alpha-N-acetylglucosaminyl 1-phosphate transferase [Prolixibacteraceae bacterium]|nr:undecaprenyl/decaprenyl-phosphate alpha-N-acetylglucosaminyl 1-phosphate transferase [Prolixibacteraceae bacterium]MBN2649071.1 undecaprenyl/decaprenyl-phosphate alpha-N-acetylglucosaminyl 1-phosphate transferase [Prolixibacteraceae bacterium]